MRSRASRHRFTGIYRPGLLFEIRQSDRKGAMFQLVLALLPRVVRVRNPDGRKAIRSLNHSIGALQQRRRELDPEGSRGLEVDDQVEREGLLHWQVPYLRAL